MGYKSWLTSAVGASTQVVKILGLHQDNQPREVFVLSIPQADQILGALHDKYRCLPEVKMVAVIQDWADMAGWWEAEGECAIAPNDTETLMEWLASLRVEELNGKYPTQDELMDCVQALKSFLSQHWAKGELVYIVNI